MEDPKFCQFCGKEIDSECIVCPYCGRQLRLLKVDEHESVNQDPNKARNNVILIIVIIFVFFLFTWVLVANHVEVDNTDDTTTDEIIDDNTDDVIVDDKVEVIDFSNMRESGALLWCKNNKLDCTSNWEYSDTIPEGDFIRQSISANQEVYENSHVTITFSYGPEPVEPTDDEEIE